MSYLAYRPGECLRAFKAPACAKLPSGFLVGLCLRLLVGQTYCGELTGTDQGYAYFHDQVATGPWSVHVFKAELNRPDLELHTTLGKSPKLGVNTVAAQMKLLMEQGREPLAAVNGDFFDTSESYQGAPRDLQITDGQLISAPSGHTCFWLDGQGKPQMTNLISNCHVTSPDGKATPFNLNQARPNDGAVLYTPVLTSTHTSGGVELILERKPGCNWLPLKAGEKYQARVKEVRTTGDTPIPADSLVLSLGPKLAGWPGTIKAGSVLELSTDMIPGVSNIKTAVGGGPVLVRDGKPGHWGGLQLRNPRTAVGWNQKYLFLVEVDGRQRISSGMTFPELADYLVKLGCDNAMNLDGGGSSTLWALGSVRNSPSEGHERQSANNLVVLKTKPTQP